ncbi:alpha/beta hydrolase [Streptomyces sp. SKN60]|uniref:alpha/beta fold hydrolase n=1 Tax=Streptomyces sp. SKN60 TaxID=2855506 RepID=UPI0022454FB9|nr:alpha/beta hydrolase [Streptomyces sp. SKN60]MCX2179015.1 alpha/beta hydrolase [Streptomyces sp. SKN60]
MNSWTSRESWTEHVLVRRSAREPDGVRLSVRDWGGDGRRPFLLLHGLAGHAGEWAGLARRLRADGHRVLALDQRGHGASERHPADVSRAAYVADVLAVLDHFALDGTVLLGQSYGGHAALLTAGRQAKNLAAVVLVEAGPGAAEPGVLDEVGGWLRAWPVPFPDRAAAVAHLGGGPVGEGWADGLEQREDGLWPRFDPEVMVASLAENTRPTGRAWWEEWAAIRVPVLAVLGEKGIIGTEEYDEMARLRPDRLRGVCLPGTGHDLHLERPELLHALVTEFLADVGLDSDAQLACPGVDSNT